MTHSGTSRARIDRGITTGVFELDGGTWEVDNNVWVVGDANEVLVVDDGSGPVLSRTAGGRLPQVKIAPQCEHGA